MSNDVGQRKPRPELLEYSNRPTLVFALLLAALVAVAVAVAVVRQPTNVDPPQDTSTTTESTIPSPAQLDAEPQRWSLLPSAETTGRTLSFVEIDSGRGSSDGAEIHTLRNGELSTRSIDGSLSSLGRLDSFFGQPGERREYLLAMAEGVVITSLGEAAYYSYDPATPAVALGEGFAAFRGPQSDQVWLLTSAENDARLVDRRSGELAVLDLRTAGRVLDSAGDGLVSETATPEGPSFALLRPELEGATFSGATGMSFLGSGSDAVVFGNEEELLILSAADPAQPGRSVNNPEEDIFRSTVSPDGRLLAASVVTSVSQPNRIVIIDLATGVEVGRSENSIEVLFQWSSPGTLVYLRPDWPAVDLVERNVELGSNLNLVHFPDLSWWYSAASTK